MAKRLTIEWSYDDPHGERQFYSEHFDLSYWPTAASRISDSRLTIGGDLLVAGKQPSSGKTVIERWELSFTSIPGPATATEVQRSTIYLGNEEGKRIARTMSPVNGVQGAVFVHFDDSNDLYRINATDGTLTLLLTPSQVPSLGFDTYTQWWGGRNAEGAYVYVYRCDPAVHQDGSVLLYDIDGDGDFEQWTEYASSSWDEAEAIVAGFLDAFSE